MRRNVEMNGLGERTEDVDGHQKTIPARVRVNEGDAWFVSNYVSLLISSEVLLARSCTITVRRRNVWMLLTSIHMVRLLLSLMELYNASKMEVCAKVYYVPKQSLL